MSSSWFSLCFIAPSFRCLLANCRQAVMCHTSLTGGVPQKCLSRAMLEWPSGFWTPPWLRPFYPNRSDVGTNTEKVKHCEYFPDTLCKHNIVMWIIWTVGFRMHHFTLRVKNPFDVGLMNPPLPMVAVRVRYSVARWDMRLGALVVIIKKTTRGRRSRAIHFHKGWPLSDSDT